MIVRLMTLLITIMPYIAYAHIIDLSLSAQNSFLVIDPVAALLLLVVAVCYFRGSRKISKRLISKHQRYARLKRWFWLGWLTLLIALVSPLDVMGEQLFAAHMVQHELIMMVATPLLVLSRPEQTIMLGGKRFMSVILHGFTGRSASMLNFYRRLAHPLPAWILHFVGLWLWHLPLLFNSGLSNAWVHSLQHVTFLLIAWVFWYSVFRLNKTNSMAAVVSLFTTAIHASLLGALLTFSPFIWYSPYAGTTLPWGLTPIEDQQLGGLIMWMPAGIVFIAAALVTLAHLLRDKNNQQTTRFIPVSAKK